MNATLNFRVHKPQSWLVSTSGREKEEKDRGGSFPVQQRYSSLTHLIGYGAFYLVTTFAKARRGHSCGAAPGFPCD